MAIKDRKQAHTFTISRETAKLLREAAQSRKQSKSSLVEDAIRKTYTPQEQVA